MRQDCFMSLSHTQNKLENNSVLLQKQNKKKKTKTTSQNVEAAYSLIKLWINEVKMPSKFIFLSKPNI